MRYQLIIKNVHDYITRNPGIFSTTNYPEPKTRDNFLEIAKQNVTCINSFRMVFDKKNYQWFYLLD